MKTLESPVSVRGHSTALTPDSRQTCLVHCNGTGRAHKPVDRKSMMAHQFDPLIHRMADKHGWEEADAREGFEDVKRFLYLAATSGKPLVPSKRIDDMWHDFILFTEDYEEFCLIHIGRFLHHRPRRRDDPKDNGSTTVIETLKLAEKTFGRLSKNWEYVVNGMQCTCSNWCQCS